MTVWGIADASGGYDEKFENIGVSIHEGAFFGNEYAQSSPSAGGVAEDTIGQQYITDISHNQVQIWAANGAYEVGTIAIPSAPYGIAVDTPHTRI